MQVRNAHYDTKSAVTFRIFNIRLILLYAFDAQPIGLLNAPKTIQNGQVSVVLLLRKPRFIRKPPYLSQISDKIAQN